MIGVKIVIDLPGDVRGAAEKLASLRNISLNDAVVELVRRGSRVAVEIDLSKPFPCFRFEAGGPPITLDQTLEVED